MIIQYDTRPDATIDEKLKSLIKSIQLAFNEVGIREDNNATSQNIDINALSVLVRELSDEVNSYNDAIARIDTRTTTLEQTLIPALDGRVTSLEGKMPATPDTDGAYKLTVTVTDGVPVYTWELA